MEVKPGYKQTEVGVIPEEWEVAELSAVTTQIGDGLHGTPLYSPNGSYFFINGNNLGDGRIVFTNETQSVGRAEFIKHRKPLGDRSILMSINGTIGNLALFNDEPVMLGKSVAFLNVSPSVSKNFIYHSLRAPKVKQQFFGGLTGSTIGNLGLATIRGTKIPLPPLEDEQRAIATALSDVDGLLGGLDRLIAKKRDLKQAAMQQLLTGQTRLPGFHGEWELNAIHELSHVGRGRVISHTEIAKAASPTYPVFSSQTSDSGIMGYLDTYDFDGDYVTWTTDGANAGTVFARSGRFNCTNVCGTIKLHDSDHRFIAAALGRVSHSHVSRHLGNPKLMNDVLKKIKITIPKTRAEQTAIAEVLSEMDGELAALEQRREKTRALKQAMMQELLTGKIRLV